jgi:hypothetical protein
MGNAMLRVTVALLAKWPSIIHNWDEFATVALLKMQA